MSGTYCDVIVVDKFIQVEGAKTLQLLSYGGLTYAIDKSIQVGDVVAVFTPDSQISEEFANANDLVDRGVDENGKKQGGFFAKNRKVRSISLMQGKIKSAGFVATQQMFDYLNIDLKDFVGQSFNEINGNKICCKYVIKHEHKNVNVTGKKQKFEKSKTIGMPEHYDTKQFRIFGSKLVAGDLITITIKCDGTSFRVANTWQVKQSLSWVEKLINKFWPIKTVWNEMKVGTRRVVLKDDTVSYYGDKSIYTDVGKQLNGLLHPGEAIYGEIVGWQNVDKPLFVRGGMRFLYGCKPGERDFYVYNIKWTLPDGSSIDLPWSKIKQRCLELGVKHVPEMSFMLNGYGCAGTFIYDGDLEKLERTVYGLVDGPDPIDPSHIREGIVLRVEHADGNVTFVKAKSQNFFELESKSKEDGVIDIEEAQEDVEIE